MCARLHVRNAPGGFLGHSLTTRVSAPGVSHSASLRGLLRLEQVLILKCGTAIGVKALAGVGPKGLPDSPRGPSSAARSLPQQLIPTLLPLNF